MTARFQPPAPQFPRLLAGPPPLAGMERFAEHQRRLGVLPGPADRRDVVSAIESSGLLGRGGAGFPVGRKWRSVAERSSGRAVVVVNGAEGEPRSAKDRTLMEYRPHLVLDGALTAAGAVGAEEIVLYVGGEHVAARRALVKAVSERERDVNVRLRLVAPPVGYVAGEATAAIHYINDGDARPTSLDERPHVRGVDGRPTLVQNVESLAHAALIVRFGADWYRSAGRGVTRGTALVTVSNGGSRLSVREIEYGTTIREVSCAAGIPDPATPGAVLLGGYFGGWAPLDTIADEPLDPQALGEGGLGFGCGVVSLLGAESCGVRATAGIIAYMAGESAAQCGPCVFGLASIAEALRRLADRRAGDDELARIERWAGLVERRGACHHPDGAIGLLRSALDTFGDEFERHAARRGCSATPSKAA